MKTALSLSHTPFYMEESVRKGFGRPDVKGKSKE